MKRVLFLFFILSSLQLPAQKTGRPLIDSLLASIPNTTDDTVIARIYNRVYNELSSISIDEAKKYARIGLAHTQKMKWPKGIAVFQNNLGRAYSDMGDYDSTLFYYNAALNTHSAAKDKFNMAVTLNNTGTAAQNIRSDYTTAATYYFKALKLGEELNDSTILSMCLNNIARIYILQKNYNKALEFDNKALRIREKHARGDEMANSLESIGKTYYLLNDIPKATTYLQQARAIYEGSGNMKGLATVWSSLSLVYGNDYRKVAEARIKSKELWDEINPMHSEAITNTGNLGVIYLDIARYDSNHLVKYGDVIPDNKTILLQRATTHLNAAIQLAGQTGDIDSKTYFTGILAELQEFSGDYKNAFYNFKLFKETEDSIFSQDNKNKIAAAESQREIDKKNSELKINQLALSNQRRTMWGLIAGLVLLSIIGLLLYRQSKIRKKTNNTLKRLNNELDNANKVKATFFAILSHDLRAPVANLINFLNLQKNAPELLSKEQAAQHEQKITNSAETLLQNMEAMLLWSKGQMENFKPVKKEIAITTLFGQIEKSFSNYDRISFSFLDADKIIVNTDENYLQTILHNLTANAVEALQKTVNPVIEWKAVKKDQLVYISIADNGPGFSADFINDWNKKNRVTSEKKGFGMHIVKDMAKAMGCKISLENTSQGALITITL